MSVTAFEPHDGSSPRGRGKPSLYVLLFGNLGLIPAWAGKTHLTFPIGNHHGAHPRVGGENHEHGRLPFGVVGSSPRGRGKRVQFPGRAACARLIPAWAGKTRRRKPALGKHWAHPRVGGENGILVDSHLCSHGSSPRGRGKLQVFPFIGTAHRLIPAWAGKTERPSPASTPPGAHPRVGGENTCRCSPSTA